MPVFDNYTPYTIFCHYRISISSFSIEFPSAPLFLYGVALMSHRLRRCTIYVFLFEEARIQAYLIGRDESESELF